MAALSGTDALHVAGTIRAPGDKSISHRALIFAALADGETRVRDILMSADVHATARALRAMGVEIPALSADFVVRGRGIDALTSPAAPLDCGNSGTTTRLLCGLVAGLSGRTARFEGDASLSRRPMRRVATPLGAMGARIEFEGAPGHDGLPMRVHGAQLRATHYANTHASAQVKGALLLAGLASGVEVTIDEPYRSRDHSERMLLARGVALETSDTGVRLPAHQRVSAVDVVVPSDPSSAMFFAALASGRQRRIASRECLSQPHPHRRLRRAAAHGCSARGERRTCGGRGAYRHARRATGRAHRHAYRRYAHRRRRHSAVHRRTPMLACLASRARVRRASPMRPSCG